MGAKWLLTQLTLSLGLCPSKKKCLDHARESDEDAVYLLGSQVLIRGGNEVMVGAGNTAWGSTGNRWNPHSQ